MDINEIKTQVILMADKVYDMLGLIERGFMEHSSEFLAGAACFKHR